MGIPLHGAWWILVYYAVVILVCNIGGEELWWRGYVLPRQELAFGRATWVIHGILWSVFHLFMQPTLWDTVRTAITGIALSFVAQHTKSTWPGILGHSFNKGIWILPRLSNHWSRGLMVSFRSSSFVASARKARFFRSHFGAMRVPS